jgi:acyl-CoA synthetase (AMP-forming)/AMP-acid ligase II
MDSFKGSIMEKLFQVLRSRADFFPHQTALMTDAGDHQDLISNQQLWQKIASVTAVFTQAKVQCIGLYMDDCSEWIICDLAAASLDVTLVPIPLFFYASTSWTFSEKRTTRRHYNQASFNTGAKQGSQTTLCDGAKLFQNMPENLQ